MAAEIVHDEAGGRFVLTRDGLESYVLYRRLSPGVVELARTYTPPPLRGRGIAARVVRHALEWADAEGLKVVPSCWFVAELIDRDPQWRRLLADR